MKLFFSALAALGLLVSHPVSADKIYSKSIPGSYISETFCTTDSSGNFSDIRNELLVLHEDGTAARYISTAIGSVCADENLNGIEMTPSYGTWKLSDCGCYVHAVFFDFFNETACTSTDVCEAGQFFAVEYDRITYTIKFFCKEKDKYQSAVANQYLLGLLLTTEQTTEDPLGSLTCPGSCDPTVLATYNDPFIPLESFYEQSANCVSDPSTCVIDPTTLYNGLPLLRSNIKFHRINVESDFLYPPAPTGR